MVCLSLESYNCSYSVKPLHHTSVYYSLHFIIQLAPERSLSHPTVSSLSPSPTKHVPTTWQTSIPIFTNSWLLEIEKLNFSYLYDNHGQVGVKLQSRATGNQPLLILGVKFFFRANKSVHNSLKTAGTFCTISIFVIDKINFCLVQNTYLIMLYTNWYIWTIFPSTYWLLCG